MRATFFSLLLLVVACGNEVAPRLHPAGDQAPGTRRVSCRLATGHGPREVSLDLPRGFVDGLPPDYRGPRCAFHSRDVVLALEPARPGHTVRDLYGDQLPDAVEGDQPEGDDSILHLTLRSGVPTYGRTVGDRLSYLCFCDGQDLLYRAAQADGVLLTWTSALPLQRTTDHQLEAILSGIGTTPDDLPAPSPAPSS